LHFPKRRGPKPPPEKIRNPKFEKQNKFKIINKKYETPIYPFGLKN
jgi:hypothetical protein